MVARAWASECWGDSGLAACCPETNEPTLMFLWHFYPEISLWSLSMEVYGTCCLRCSKWLLGAWLDSFHNDPEMLIGRLSQMRPAPLSLWHCDPECMFNEKRFQVNGATWDALPPGVQVLPHCVVCSYRARQPLQMWQIHISTKSTLWAMSLWILVAKVLDNGC